ncbi:MAG TPA: FG-GAP-like repeat-containing protein [Jatrophihabitantaceae bacterium]|nr:FG-GAP-like repeat-containing protein [Jatrophihabitantaceae bacterium]
MVAAIVMLLATVAPGVRATVPFPQTGGDPYDYTRLHITNGSCAFAPGETTPTPAGTDLPKGFDCRTSTKLTDYAAQPGDADYDPAVSTNPQELFGVKGPGTNRAWEVTTGRPDTAISVLDSGIEWNTPELVNKVRLNWGELPVPCSTAPCTTTYATSALSYDVNHDGVFNIADYAGDPRLHPENGSYLTAQDLIRTFSDGVDHDGNGYVNDIAGWDFYQHDNDPSDDVTYGHGTGEAKDSSAEIETTVTQCANCEFVPLRVGDSFIADVNRFAEAVVYATDNGVSLVQEALGTVDHTGFAQAAVDYAYQRGVLIVASEADEAAGHHNYPAALNHTMVVNSVTHFIDESGVQVPPKTYLALNGCTNFGGYTWVSAESNSCSSDATGQSAGMAGLLYSAARNAVDLGVIKPASATRPLTAEEAKQLFRLAADDIDFSTPKPPGPPNNFATGVPASQRYVTTAGWDQITGWGRVSSNTAVRLVQAGHIPPEADITSPRWWQVLGTSGTVDITGRVAAPRAHAYTYEVQFPPGVQPPRWPLADTWTTIATGAGTSPKSGKLATLDLAAVRAAIDAAPPVYTPLDDPTSRDLPEKDAFRVRVVTHADGDLTTPWKTAIEQRQYFASTDDSLFASYPTYLNADGASSPAFADVDGDAVDEMVIADGNGFVHAFKADATEAKGWPVHTDEIPLPHSGHNAFTRGELSSHVFAPLLLGSPTVADLDGDGRPEIAAADITGTLHVWHHDGTPVAGFPVHDNPAYSQVPGCQLGTGPDCDEFSAHPVRDHVNTVDRAFSSMPSAGDLDTSVPGLELVVGSMDGHVYAFHADGSPVKGWPVLLRDPAKVASVDPVSHRVTFVDGANEKYGRQVLTTPTLGDVDGDGQLEVAVNVDEEYEDPPNLSVRDVVPQLVGQVTPPGNTRTYLLHHDGTAHPGTERVANLGDNAYVAGWPVPIYMVQTELLPDVGSGSNGAPVMADVDGDGVLEIATASIGSPPYLLRADGSSFYGNGPDGKYLTMASSAAEFKSAATDGSSIASLGGGAFGRLAGSSSPLTFAMGSTGLRRLLDVVLPEQQLGAEDHVGAWDATTGTYEPGFPAQMNDLMFFNTPAIADIDGDGNAEVLQSSAMYDLRAYSLGGLVPAGWPKFTGGWSVSTPAVGDLDGDGRLDVALPTREGDLRVWHTAGDACQAKEWPKYQHDLHNSGTYGTDATPPAALRDVTMTRNGATVTISWIAPGDDGVCGTADHYRVVVGGTTTGTAPAPAPAGTRQTLTIQLPKGKTKSVQLQAYDGAGNAGFPAVITVR